MMKRKLLMVVTLAVCLVTSFTGCKKDKDINTGSTGGGTVNEAGVLPIVKDKITIKAFAAQNARTQDLATNDATVELEKRTNIHLDLVIVPDTAVAEKKQLLLASGDYPEIFIGGAFTNEEIMNYGAQQKIFKPLNALIDKYGPEIKKTFAEISNFKPDITAPDGNIYGLPQINDCYHCYLAQKMWINTTWLDKLGLKMPKTTEDFYNVLKAFKTKDPNGNGKADEIPLTGAIKSWHAEPQHFLMCSFIYDDGASYFQVNNGKLDYVANKPEWKEGIKYLNKLYKEGLIDPAAFTQSGDQLKKVGDNPGTPIVGTFAAGHVAMGMTMNDDPANVRHKQYSEVPPLTGPNGVRTTGYYKGISGASFVITDKCKNPEAALRLVDYMYSTEGTLLMEEGPEGKRWVKAKPEEKDFLGNNALWSYTSSFDQGGKVQNECWLQTATTKRTADGYRNRWAVDQNVLTEKGYEKRLFDATKRSYDGLQPKEWYNSVFLNSSDVAEMAQLKTSITDYANSSMVQFITGALDVDKEWDNYLKKLDSLQLKKYLDTYAKAYDTKMKNK